MTNHIAGVAKLLGVKLGESFKIVNDTQYDYKNYYRFTESAGIEISDDGFKWEMATAAMLKCLLMGDVRIAKLPWIPARNDTYYYPTPSGRELWEHTIWVDSKYDGMKLSRGLVYKTKGEAIVAAEKMLAALQEASDSE